MNDILDEFYKMDDSDHYCGLGRDDTKLDQTRREKNGLETLPTWGCLVEKLFGGFGIPPRHIPTHLPPIHFCMTQY